MLLLKIDSFSLLRNPLLSYVQVISYAISLVCLFKYSYSYFLSRFCYLDFVGLLFVFKLILSLAPAVSISLPSFFVLVGILKCCIDKILNVSEYSSSFFSWYIYIYYVYASSTYSDSLKLWKRSFVFFESSFGNIQNIIKRHYLQKLT